MNPPNLIVWLPRIQRVLRWLQVPAWLLLLGPEVVSWAAGTTATVSWTAPTMYVDGTALPAGDVAFYTVSWAPAPGKPGPVGSMKVTSGTTAQVPVACGDTQFFVSVTTGASAVYPNAASSATGPVPYSTGVSCSPNPPTGLAAH